MLFTTVPAGTAKTLLVKDGKTLAEKDISTHAPRVDFSFDGGGQTLSGTQHLTWKASDEDNDPLFMALNTAGTAGDRTLTALVRDSDGMIATAQIHVKVLPAEKVNTQKAVSLWQVLLIFGTPLLLLVLILAGVFLLRGCRQET